MDRTDRYQHGRGIRTVDDVLRLLDGLFAPEADRWSSRGASWWDGFYADRDRPVPFFVAKPDENLVRYVDRGLIGGGGRALDLGCGPGRNALQLAAWGFEVDGVDLSPTAVAWAEERARGRDLGRDLGRVETGVGGGEGEGPRIRFHCGDVFALAPTQLPGPYDLVYDSGCFHHLPPHRRISYLALLDQVLAPGGHFALTCFAAGGMGSELPDAELYRGSGLQGGLAYRPDELRWIFAESESALQLEEVEIRRMRDEPDDSPCFGEDFLWTALFRRGTGA
ncbi:class I SAM-dependent methyltransferase [Streptomyces prunicolor]|uniref:class I SAM-dependent methyltransferase n=1 Tax=Streptomyces prunicolor TaxID=67348 RepID=UPI00386E1AF6|nr:class I SAM-dependent methyltransferase [Streptomyces prunicolor]